MAPRLSGQTSIFGVVFFVSKSLLRIERQKKLKKFTILTRKPRSHFRILIYRTWPINDILYKTIPAGFAIRRIVMSFMDKTSFNAVQIGLIMSSGTSLILKQ